MLPKIQQINAALSRHGEPAIESLEQLSETAKLIYNIYDACRQDLMAMHPWKFATKWTNLAAEVVVPDAGYTYAYKLPSDMVKLREVWSSPNNYVVTNFRNQGGLMLSNDTGISLFYTFDNQDETSWPPYFDQLMISRLAYETAYAITKSTSLMEVMERQYRMQLKVARNLSAQDGASQTLGRMSSSLYTARRSYA